MHITAYNKQKLLLLAINNYIDHLNLGDSAFIKRNLDKLTLIICKRSFILKEKEGRGKNTFPSILLAVSRVVFLMDHLVPFFFLNVFFTKKLSDFKVFVLAGHIIQSGKHTIVLGIRLLNLLKEGMNTGRDYLDENVNNLYKESLIKKVLAMVAVYLSNKDGLRIDSNSLALISNQLFFILASSSDGDSVIFYN